MPGLDSLTMAAIVAAQLSYHQKFIGQTGTGAGGGGGPVIPTIAVQFDSGTGTYQIIEGNTDVPDAWFVDVGGGVIELQAGATTGLSIENQSGEYVLVAP